MHFTKRHLLAFIGSILVTNHAVAADDQAGYFLKPYLGLSILGDSDAKINNLPGFNGNYDLKQDTGFVGG